MSDLFLKGVKSVKSRVLSGMASQDQAFGQRQNEGLLSASLSKKLDILWYQHQREKRRHYLHILGILRLINDCSYLWRFLGTKQF